MSTPTPWAKLDALPTTNLRIVVSIALFVLYVLGTMALSAFGRAPSIEVLSALGGSILIAMGLDVAQFRIKRNTTLVTPPTVMATDAAAPSVAASTDAAPRTVGVAPRAPTASTSTTQALPVNAKAPAIVKDD